LFSNKSFDVQKKLTSRMRQFNLPIDRDRYTARWLAGGRQVRWVVGQSYNIFRKGKILQVVGSAFVESIFHLFFLYSENRRLRLTCCKFKKKCELRCSFLSKKCVATTVLLVIGKLVSCLLSNRYLEFVGKFCYYYYCWCHCFL
jgi:hypothetical protein